MALSMATIALCYFVGALVGTFFCRLVGEYYILIESWKASERRLGVAWSSSPCLYSLGVWPSRLALRHDCRVAEEQRVASVDALPSCRTGILSRGAVPNAPASAAQPDEAASRWWTIDENARCVAVYQTHPEAQTWDSSGLQ